MFVLTENPVFTAPITVARPVRAGFDESTFTAEFKVLGDSKLADVEMNDIGSLAAFLRDVLLDFDDVQAADGSELAFSSEARDALIDIPYVRLALVKGYFETLYKASAGN